RLACWLRLRTFRASSCMRIWSVRGSSWRTSSAGAFALQDEGRASNATSQRIRQLERELARKEKALAEAAALLVLKKDREGSSRRGRRRRRAERELIPTGIGKARSSGARLSAACKIAGISARTIERWRSAPHADDRRCGPHRRPANALSPRRGQLRSQGPGAALRQRQADARQYVHRHAAMAWSHTVLQSPPRLG